MSIEIKQMVIKSSITQAQSQDKNTDQSTTDNGQKKIILSEFNRSINKLVSQKRER